MFARKMLMPTILSLSLLTFISTSAVSPVLGEIGDHFSSADKTLVQLVAVMHSVSIVPSLLMASLACTIFPKKTVLISGLVLFTVSGISGALATNIYLLLFTRIIMGVGLGFSIPFSTSLISDFYENEEKARMMGFSSSFNMIGGMVSLLLAGQLGFISWNLPFLIYGFGIPVIFLTAFFLPDLGKVSNKKITSSSARLGKEVYFLAFCMFVFCVLLFILNPTMAQFLRANGLGDARMAGLSIAFASMGGIVSGLMLQRSRQLTRQFFLPSMLTLSSMGFVLLAGSTALTAVFVGAFIIGFANRSVYPIFFLKATEGVTPDQSVKVTALLSSMIYLGQFMAPPFQRFVSFFFNRPETRFLYIFVAAVTLIAGTLLFISIYFLGRKTNKSTNIVENRTEVR